MALVAVAGAFLVARGAPWSLVALPLCVCAIGLAAYVVGDSVAGRPTRTPAVAALVVVTLLGVVVGVMAFVTGGTAERVFTVVAVLGTVLAAAGTFVQLRRGSPDRSG